MIYNNHIFFYIMNMELKIINIKLKAAKFVHLGCGNLTEEEEAKSCIKELREMSHEQVLNMKKITKVIEKHGKVFSKNGNNILAEEELYNQFVGDVFELFAEFFFKTCSTVGQYGVVNYEPAVNNDDWGVDGYGIAADQRESVGGTTPVVIQIKFRSNPMDEISYTMLAKTGWDGVKNYHLDINRKNNVILLCNTEKGANYLAHSAMGDNLYVVDMRQLDKDVTGIRTTVFWDNFLASMP